MSKTLRSWHLQQFLFRLETCSGKRRSMMTSTSLQGRRCHSCSRNNYGNSLNSAQQSCTSPRFGLSARRSLLAVTIKAGNSTCYSCMKAVYIRLPVRSSSSLFGTYSQARTSVFGMHRVHVSNIRPGTSLWAHVYSVRRDSHNLPQPGRLLARPLARRLRPHPSRLLGPA